jgi:fatty-acyl-CoA synthase
VSAPQKPSALPAQAARLSLSGLMLQQAARTPDRVALECGPRSLTYRELHARAARLADALRARGLVAGDRVAVLSENRGEYVELEVAAARLGIILACQNWRQSDEELEYCIRLVSPKLLVHSRRYAQAAARIDHGVPHVLEIEAGFEALVAEGRADARFDEVDPESGLIILYTSGTTGMPKGALISQRAMVARAMVARFDSPLQPGDAFVAWGPLFHMVSTDSVYGTLMHGGKVIVMDGLDVPELVRVAAREFVGHFTLMPGMIDRVIEEIERTGLKPKGARTIGAMADLVPLDQIAKVTRLFDAPYKNSFGSTETGGPPAGRGVIPVGMIPERLSKLQNSFCEIRLVDEDDVEVPDGQPGELAFRGPTLFSGYWANDEANAKDFRGGWFHMGDVFVRNPDGTLDFVDRRKYLIKTGGENVYPAEIERVLLASDRVAEAVVVRRPDPKWGEAPVAFVARADDTLTEDEVKAMCRGRIAGYKVPRDVVFIGLEEFPRSATGKVKRHELEERVPKPRG